MNDITPDEARKILDDGLFHLTEIEMNLYLERALAALAAMRAEITAMRVEEDYHIVTPENNGGAYQLRRHTRHVTEWSAECP